MIKIVLLVAVVLTPLICNAAPGSYSGYLEDDGGYAGGSIPYFEELYFAYFAVLVFLKLKKSEYVSNLSWIWVPVAPAIAAGFSFWLIGITIIFAPIYLIFKLLTKNS
ncbi:hypothetical protein [Methylomonas rivi]|uniref:Uncharacterized protein n=1 Tax=Methylomonas rivi TaxID=2952226 RepID=A0ABT1U5D5_9GAMM|nr:hypothetical protein [Methylomonas sp. WSC-6]MBS4052709.1 hypothetical protein [Methylomonas sp.]MCQ8129073.1 hypothetical protein [Methylomonas sp. WSC-6]